ncbi:hypothetical protein [Kribbella sp. DT2]|uniref:hypothetical protein n=1 Tax=Kribbella sp. DT2 TaxID=3393427 RepID=UPI003CF2941E
MNRSLRRAASVVAGGAALCLASAGIASAETPSSEQIAAAVYSAPDASAAFAALPADQQAVFAARMANWISDEVASGPAVKREPTVQEQIAMGPAGMAASGCWTQYQYHTWKDLGIKTGVTWMTANWCSNGSRITSYNIAQPGGQGYKGIKYNGTGQKFINNVGWEVRQAQQFNFSVVWATAQPCMQIRGGATGLHSYRADCNLG